MQIVNVMAASLDGRIGFNDRESDAEREVVGISCAADQQFLRSQIESSDAIIVGATSIRANGACLYHRGLTGQPPPWFIFAKNDLPLDIAFWGQGDVPRYLVSPSPLFIPKSSLVQNLVFGDQDPALFLVDYLRRVGIRQSLLFGGGIVNNWFYRKNLVDELRLTLAPLVIGQEAAPYLIAPELTSPINFTLLSSHVEESFVFLRYKVHKS